VFSGERSRVRVWMSRGRKQRLWRQLASAHETFIRGREREKVKKGCSGSTTVTSPAAPLPEFRNPHHNALASAALPASAPRRAAPDGVVLLCCDALLPFLHKDSGSIPGLHYKLSHSTSYALLKAAQTTNRCLCME